MALNPTYSVGTVSVSAGSAIVNGDGTLFVAGGLRAGDVFERDGLSITLAETPVSNTQLTLVKPWPGVTGSGAYEVRYTADASRVIGGARELIAGLEGLDDKIAVAQTAPFTPYQSYAEAFSGIKPLILLRVSAVVSGRIVEWVRRTGGPCLGGGWVPAADAEPGHFGVVTGLNDTAVLQAWLNFGGRLLLTGDCGFNAPLTASVAGTEIIGGGGRMVWTGAYYALDGVTLAGSGSIMHGVEIDGADLLAKGVLITGAGCDATFNVIHHMRSTTGTSTGIHATSRTGGRIALNYIHHIHSVGNATTGDANGAARAVLVQGTDDLLAPYDVVDNDIHDITGEEGDGIQILLLGGTTFRTSLKSRIARNRVKGCSKRCIKVQAHDVIVEENAVLLDVTGAYSAMDIINSSRCAVFDNDIEVTATDGRGIQYNSFDVPTFGRCADAEIRRNRVKMPVGSAHIGIYVFLLDRPVTSGNRITGGRIIIDNCVSPVANDNCGHDVELSSSDGLVSIRNNCIGATANGNTLFSGSAYTCVRVDAAGSFMSGNRNHSTVSNAASVVFLTVGGCVITGNVNAKPAVPAVRYNTGITEAMQLLVANNVQMV